MRLTRSCISPGTRNARGSPLARLFCFPYAGAGASVFRDWQPLLPDGINVIPVQLPGRETRFLEPAFDQLQPLVSELARELRPSLDGVFAFFGHSVGALVAFELARELVRCGRTTPAHLFVSGAAAPHILTWKPVCHMWSDSELIQQLVRISGLPQEVANDPASLAALLPALRADLVAYQTYTYWPDVLLECAVTAYGGRRDPEVRPHELLAWRALTSGTFNSHLFRGHHLFLHTGRKQLVTHLSVELSRTLMSLNGCSEKADPPA